MDSKVCAEGLRLPADCAADPQEEDIYRGEPPSPSRSPPPRPPSVATASSSSSGWSGLGLRRGALGAVLELAINRWARASSGSSTSSSSSSSSIHTHLPRRRRRRSSNGTSTLHAHSESIIRARRKARDECRVLQREFALFLPASLTPPALNIKPLPGQKPAELSQSDRILKSSSLPLVLTQLDSAIKRSAKLRRPKQLRNASPARALEPWFNDYVQAGPSLTDSQVDTLRDDKGKTREKLRVSETLRRQVRADAEQIQRQQAWWLDVSSPTWSDMREIAKILHLHPLTLEDILHQDPREKLELFPRLGYYFIVFRALESQHARSSARAQADTVTINDSASFDDNIILGTNVYVVVFRDGICSFHFEDIADHVDRVRNKIMYLEETLHMSSDWIAHGILDSIVDDFFPMLNSIEQEIKLLDDLLLSDGHIHQPLEQSSQNPSTSNNESPEKTTDETVFDGKEKIKSDSSSSDRMLRKAPGGRAASWFALSLRRLGAVSSNPVLRRWVRFSSRSIQTPRLSPLMRMASTRRLVTSLSRLLGTKSEVVSQIRKRLTNGGSMGSKPGPFEHALSAEVGIYFGDIQDHILTLQHSLAHYERMLSHSHPAYISHLRVSLSQAKGGMDMAILTLSVISVSVVAMQVVTGMFSTNLGRIPSNRRPIIDGPPQPPAPFNVFGAVLAVVILVGSGMIFLSRYWWLYAKKKYARRRRSNL